MINASPDTSAIMPLDDEAAIAVFGKSMGIRALSQKVSSTVAEVAATRLPVILTNNGRPVAAIVPLAPDTRD